MERTRGLVAGLRYVPPNHRAKPKNPMASTEHWVNPQQTSESSRCGLRRVCSLTQIPAMTRSTATTKSVETLCDDPTITSTK